MNRGTQPVDSENLTNNLRYLANGARYDVSYIIQHRNRKSYMDFPLVAKSMTLNKHSVAMFASRVGFSTVVDLLVWPASLSRDRN